MKLRQLIQSLPTLEVEGPLDQEVRGLAYDSRRVVPGTVFVALRGEHTDGHAHIHDAIDRGAVAVICESNGFSPQRATKIVVPNSREALAQAATAFHDHPSRRLKVIGVTGTNGKTTVSFLVAHILRQAGIPTGLLGTIRYEIGDRVIPATRTTPEALEIQQMLAQMHRAGCTACVMEVSSHALAQQRILGVDFDVAIFTNLTRDHLDYHGSMENYFAAKLKLFAALQHGSKRGAAVINIDDPYGGRIEREQDLSVRLTYGLGEAAQLRGRDLVLQAAGSRFAVEYGQGRFLCEMPLIGRHNVYNALAAAGAGLMLDLKPPVIQKALSSLPPVPGRLERVAGPTPFAVFVDYAHTEDALRHALQTLRELTSGRLLLVFGCGGTRDRGKRPAMGRVAAELADRTWITNDNPRREEPAAIAGMIADGFRQGRAEGLEIELDRQRAIEAAIREARPGDTLLIAGKGHETYQEFDGVVVPFDDVGVAREALNNRREATRPAPNRRRDVLLV